MCVAETHLKCYYEKKDNKYNHHWSVKLALIFIYHKVPLCVRIVTYYLLWWHQ